MKTYTKPLTVEELMALTPEEEKMYEMWYSGWVAGRFSLLKDQFRSELKKLK